ncbi:fungal-specific transcription factor domain-containing protein [Rhexocercosporidium sp. MPI-PUGE-AT-0058]|nr:fungal-specific transcription factor domain-containing protein [Rhexocercosporidium sp. MPI-PUGE-AT-0058]
MPDRVPAPFTTVFPASGPQSRKLKRNRPTVSCTACQKRKLRCDRHRPCGACERRGQQSSCDFNAASHGNSCSSDGDKQEVLSRLANLEKIVRGLANSSNHVASPSMQIREEAGEDASEIPYVSEAEDITSVLEAEPLEPYRDHDVIFGDLSSVSIVDIINCLPPRSETDRLVSVFFSSHLAALPFLHTHQFRRQYEAFWESPSVTNLLWISILFSVLSISALISRTRDLSTALAPFTFAIEPQVYQNMAAQCLVSGKYTQATVYSVEAILAHVHSRNVVRKDSNPDPTMWSLCVLAVRVAQRRGYHRSPKTARLNISPFEAEVRRRVWFTIRSVDLSLSSRHGMPPIVHEEDCDVDIPSNLTDDDFDEDCPELPPEGSFTAPTPVLFYIQSAKVFQTLCRINRRALGVKPSTAELVKELSEALDSWHESIPPCLAYRPITTTAFTDANHTIMHRIMLELIYLNSRGFLYCPYIISTKGLCREPAKSMDFCREAALKIIDIQLQIDQEMSLGGRLYEDRHIISSLTLNDFLNAAMFICVDLTETDGVADHEREASIDMLRRSHDLWLKRIDESSDARFACRVLQAILKRIEFSHQISRLVGNRLLLQRASNEPMLSDVGVPTEPFGMTMNSIPQCSTALVFKAFNEPLSLEVFTLPTSASAGSALIKILTAIIRPHYREHFSGRGFLHVPAPSIPGHACIGRVLAVGPDAAALHPGQLVFAHGFTAARDDAANTGVIFGLHRNNGLGTERAGILFDHWKGFWQSVNSVPLENCVALDEHRLVKELHYGFNDLMYLDRLSVAYGAISAAKLIAGEIVIVAPATGHYSGAVAELAAQIGCRVIALTRTASKLTPLTSRHPNITAVELAGHRETDVAAIRRLFPTTNVGGADAFIDISPPQATGNSHHFDIGIEVLRPKSRAVLAGALQTATIPYWSLLCRDITIIGKWMFTSQEMNAVARMVEAGVIKLGKEAGHETVGGGFKFEEWEKGLLEAEGAVEWGRHVMFMP